MSLIPINWQSGTFLATCTEVPPQGVSGREFAGLDGVALFSNAGRF
jgi:hypothetical protein